MSELEVPGRVGGEDCDTNVSVGVFEDKFDLGFSRAAFEPSSSLDGRPSSESPSFSGAVSAVAAPSDFFKSSEAVTGTLVALFFLKRCRDMNVM